MRIFSVYQSTIDYGSANTADHLLLARRFVASGRLQKKACFACLLAWLAWLAWLACFVAAWLLRSALQKEEKQREQTCRKDVTTDVPK